MAKNTENKNTEIKTSKDFLALVARIDKSNPQEEDIELLSSEFNKYPELYRSVNPHKAVMKSVVNSINDNLSVKLAIEKNLEEMRNELGYYQSTFVEKMIIEEVLMCWLRLISAESSYNAVIAQSHSMKIGAYHEKRIETLHKRFLRVMESLAKVRKMIALTQAKGAEMFKNLMSK